MASLRLSTFSEVLFQGAATVTPTPKLHRLEGNVSSYSELIVLSRLGRSTLCELCFQGATTTVTPTPKLHRFKMT
jgi:hypothetical protein